MRVGSCGSGSLMSHARFTVLPLMMCVDRSPSRTTSTLFQPVRSSKSPDLRTRDAGICGPPITRFEPGALGSSEYVEEYGSTSQVAIEVPSTNHKSPVSVSSIWHSKDRGNILSGPTTRYMRPLFRLPSMLREKRFVPHLYSTWIRTSEYSWLVAR